MLKIDIVGTYACEVFAIGFTWCVGFECVAFVFMGLIAVWVQFAFFGFSLLGCLFGLGILVVCYLICLTVRLIVITDCYIVVVWRVPSWVRGLLSLVAFSWGLGVVGVIVGLR